MPTACSAQQIRRLLDEVGNETSLTPVHGNFPEIFRLLNERHKKSTGENFTFSQTYFYRSLYSPLVRGHRQLSLEIPILDAICKSIGYLSYTNFINSEHPALNKVLEKCIGAWYSYVRCNSGNPDVLVSPVHIYAKGKTILMLLQGKARKFAGEMKLKGKCIYCVLESESDKQIHLVLKVGLSDSPDVLQGVFSGISSGEDPIAGREILARQDMPFEKMKNDKLKIETLCASDNEKEKIIGNYFRERDRNILSAGRSSTFTFSDLHEDAGSVKRKTR